MKITKGFYVSAILSLVMSASFSQNVSTRTNEFEVDLSDAKKLVNSAVPVINWITPVAETNYAQEPKYTIKFEIVSSVFSNRIVRIPTCSAP